MISYFDAIIAGQTVPTNPPKCENLQSYLPQDFSLQKFSGGKRFFQKFLVGVLFSYFIALIVGFYVPNLAHVLLYTGQSIGADKSRKRYLDTLMHLYVWHAMSDAELLRSLQKVNSLHRNVAQKMTTNLPSPVPYFSQYDFALTQCGFVAFVLLYARQCGLDYADNELDDYIYFWYVIGHLLGIEDAFNVCRKSAESARACCQTALEEVVVPCIKNRSPESDQLVEDLVSGMQKIGLLLITRNAVCALFFPYMGLEFPEMSVYDWFVYGVLRLQFTLYYFVPYYRRYLNNKVEQLINQYIIYHRGI